MEKTSQTIIKEVKGENSFLVLIKKVEDRKDIVIFQPLYVGSGGRQQDPIKVYAEDLFNALEELQFAPTRTLSEEAKKLLPQSVDVLELSARSSMCLHDAKIETVGQLIQKTPDDLLRARNFGRKSLNEINEALAGHGLSLKDS